MEVELASAEFVGNVLQRCRLMPGDDVEPTLPCPALGWPACDISSDICDLLGVRMQVE